MPIESKDSSTARSEPSDCQLESFPSLLDGGPPSREEPWLWYFRRRGRNLLLKLRDAMGIHRSPTAPRSFETASVPPPLLLQVGDVVRVQSVARIQATLDSRGALKGCRFAIGMYHFCGQELRVAKVVTRFFDESQKRMLKAQNMVLLEGAHCDGSISPACEGCDRMCFYFWRTEWLEKVEAHPGQDQEPTGGSAIQATSTLMK